MRITRLEAKNIGPFENLNIDFKPKPAGMENKAEIHILTGENGTGKTTILLILAELFKEYSPKSKLFSRIHNGKGLFITTDLPTINGSEIIEIREYAIERWGGRVIQDFLNNIKTKKPENINFAFFGYSGYRTAKGDGIVNIEEITLNPFEDALNFERFIDSNLIIKWIANVKTKELIAKGKGNDSSSYTNTVQEIENTLSRITGKTIEFDLEESLKVSIKINGLNLAFDVLPDGLKSIISWLSDLLMRLDRINWADKTRSILEQNFILFLDEIEVHLHPSWQRKILPVVQDLFPNAQIFISTHSPFVVGSVDGARVYKFKLDENNNSYLDSEYWTEDGNSYDRILEEIFDIKERFGVGVQKQLEEFKSYKNKVMVGESIDNEAFMNLANDIAKQSIELNGIIGFELRQLKKNTAHILETA